MTGVGALTILGLRRDLGYKAPLKGGSTDTFIVRFWSKIFAILSWISPFKIIVILFPRLKSHLFVDFWVFGHTIVAFLAIFISPVIGNSLFAFVIFIYGMVRVFEIIIYQINVLLFDEYRAGKSYALKSYRRLVILLLHNYAEIIFWFSASYIILSSEFMNMDGGTGSLDVFFSSFATMTTFGSSSIKPVSKIGMILVWGQSITGLLMTLLSLARFIGLLPKPATLDPHETD